MTKQKDKEIDEKIKKEIDDMSYVEMLKIWRFGLSEDKRLNGEEGKYFSKVMQNKKNELSPNEITAASKMVGWDTPL